MRRLHCLLFIYMAAASLVIGLLTGGYLELINLVIALFWKVIPQALNLSSFWRPWLICLPMGLLIGYCQRRLGQYPLTIEQVLTKVKLTGYFSYHHWHVIMCNSLLVLGAGGSIGPEASATDLVTGMIYWLGGRYKLTMANQERLGYLSCWQQVRAIIGRRSLPRQSAISARPLAAYFPNRRVKRLAYDCWTVLGILGLALFFLFFPQEGVIGIHTPVIHWQWQGVLVIIPALVSGWLGGWIFVKFGQVSTRLFGTPTRQIAKGLIGGVILAIASLLTKDVLFSGEFSIQNFAQKALTYSPYFLLIFAVVKALVTNLGFALGWRGGTIFPAIFSSLAIGVMVAQFLGWMPQLTVTIVVTTAITVIINQPLLTVVLMCLLLPIQFVPVFILAAYLTKYALDKVPQLKP